MVRGFEEAYTWWAWATERENALADEAPRTGRTPINRVRFAYEAARDYFLIGVVAGLVCRARGHRISVTSDIGPDHGLEWLECTRCWRSWENVYY